ncbi:putative repeat protein (TIGR02543 family) [Ruminiclostridium sufflavum DSM 19573]|uniref:Putative repeat protein (TIGR02543 family) n=1 Tax=Ruminiclostridium sufflavum DSM 19573 TaxID=1121337 RepID=A0A318XMM0_9FIRM|nr:InlB B-repeat-containing protein [Ruminiclostridium sufflavum]PYG87809.1 putative repeat protein (TIGR02543 family) [Ruminiclostridium sufflavum DSM 19573]
MHSRISTGILFFAFIIISFFSVNIYTVFAEDVTLNGITYNENDYAKLKTFLNLSSSVAGKTNGKMVNSAYDENNPATWSGIVWSEDAVKRVKSIAWSKKSLAGELDVSGAVSLTSLVCDSNALTAINVSGASKLTNIRCNTNKLTCLDVSTNTNLDTLYCHTNNLETLNVGTNSKLLYLYCYTNKLTSLNVSACTLLSELYCYSNQLAGLDVTANTALSKLACESNKIIALDVSKNTALTYLACYSNKLTELKVDKLVNLLALHCYSNEIEALDVSKNLKLTTLFCNNNPLGKLDVSKNTALTSLRCDLDRLTELDVSKNTALTSLQCDTNKLTTLDLSNNPELATLKCYSNLLTDINIESNSKLTKLMCDTNKLKELNVSNNTLLNYLACYSNQLSSLDLRTNTELAYLYCQENQLKSLDVHNNTGLLELYCNSNQLTELDVSANKSLTYLRCYSNLLRELKLDHNTALSQLACQSNKLTELDVSNNELLTNLTCNTNQLSELDVSNNKVLTTLYCQFNELTGLDLSSNDLLTDLYCYSNRLTSMNTSLNTKLKNVWCYSNQLVSVDLSKSPDLTYLNCADNYLSQISVNVSGKSIDIRSNGKGYVELLRNSTFQFCATAKPHTGSSFAGWMQAGSKVSEELSYNLNVGAPYDLKANFSQRVVFDSVGGSAVEEQTVDYNGIITAPAGNPQKTGFNFAGWYKEPECINAWDFSSGRVTGYTVLYAGWTAKTYIVSFDADGGSSVPDITDAAYGSTISKPVSPSKELFSFKGWYKEPELLNTWNFSADIVTENITLYAGWQVNSTYTVEFDVGGGSILARITDITSGSAITTLIEPEKPGCKFKGWYKDMDFKAVWDFDTDVVTENITLYAKWEAVMPEQTYVVMFDANGGSKVPKINSIIPGSLISAPAQGTVKPGYEFKGWYKDSGYSSIWDFASDTVTEDTILYAKWAINSTPPLFYTVTFNVNGGSEVKVITNISYGSTIAAPAEPVKAAYNFKGWYKDSEYKSIWNFASDTVTENTLLYAKWEEKNTPPSNKYTVTFNVNGGSYVSDITVTSGSAVTAPQEPSKAGSDFAGWYKDAAFKDIWDFAADFVSSDIVLHAKWTEKALPELFCVVLFDSNGGSKVAAKKEVLKGSAVTAPEKPTKAGYSFAGWYIDSALKRLWDFNTDTVAEDMILYAKWQYNDNGGSPAIIGTVAGKDNAPVIINGETEFFATDETGEIDGKLVTRIIIDNNKISQKIEKSGLNPSIVIPIKNTSEIKIAELNGQAVKGMEAKGAIIEISTGQITYTLPAKQINIDKVCEKIGSHIELKDIMVNIKISDSPADIQNLLQKSVSMANYRVVTNPVEFDIICEYGETKVDVSRFNSYVKRTIAIPDIDDLNKITTGVVLNGDGTFSHVPTIIEEIDGKCYAEINSLTNSIYSVIWSPRTFADVESHWSKAAVNDMGSRLVINGVGNEIFEPNRDITRAEFAEIVVKGLGLMRIGTFKSSFGDVDKAAWYYDSVAIASEYGLISGYGNGKFGPNDKITREQAMTVIAKAMKITGLKVEFKIGEVENILMAFGDAKQASHWAKECMAACVKAGIVSGRNGHTIVPEGYITRAETAVIVRNLLKKSDLI